MFLLCARREGDVYLIFHFPPCVLIIVTYMRKSVTRQNWWKKPISAKKRLQKNDLCFWKILTLSDNQLLRGLVDFPFSCAKSLSCLPHFPFKTFPSFVREINSFIQRWTEVDGKKKTKKQRRPKSLEQEKCFKFVYFPSEFYLENFL